MASDATAVPSSPSPWVAGPSDLDEATSSRETVWGSLGSDHATARSVSSAGLGDGGVSACSPQGRGPAAAEPAGEDATNSVRAASASWASIDRTGSADPAGTVRWLENHESPRRSRPATAEPS